MLHTISGNRRHTHIHDICCCTAKSLCTKFLQSGTLKSNFFTLGTSSIYIVNLSYFCILLVNQTPCGRCCGNAEGRVLVISGRKTFWSGAFLSFFPQILCKEWCKKGIRKYFCRFYFVFPQAPSK